MNLIVRLSLIVYLCVFTMTVNSQENDIACFTNVGDEFEDFSYLMFGNINFNQVYYSEDDIAEIEVTTTANANVRAMPTTSGAIIGNLTRGQTVVAHGRNDDGSWIYIILPNNGNMGWVFGDLLSDAALFQDLATVNADTGEIQPPGTLSFLLSSSVEKNCPESYQGVILQTSTNGTWVNVVVNEISLWVNGTVFITLDGDENLQILPLEGMARILHENTPRFIRPGETMTYGQDEQIISTISEITLSDLHNDDLKRPVNIEAMEANYPSNVLPADGHWVTEYFARENCPPNVGYNVGETLEFPTVTFRFDGNGNLILFDLIYSRISDSVFQRVDQDGLITLYFATPTYGETTIESLSRFPGCILYTRFYRTE